MTLSMGFRLGPSVEIRMSEAFEAGVPRPLFATQMLPAPYPSYDVTADGQRFLVSELARTGQPEPITLIVDGTALLEKR
jgi:hypothetical protein